MTNKTDPYATKLHKRVDVLLLVFTVVVIALLLGTSAHGQTTKIRSEWENDDWWAERAPTFFSRYQFTLQASNLRLGSGDRGAGIDSITANQTGEQTPELRGILRATGRAERSLVCRESLHQIRTPPHGPAPPPQRRLAST